MEIVRTSCLACVGAQAQWEILGVAEQLLQDGQIRNASAVTVCGTLEKCWVSQGAQSV